MENEALNNLLTRRSIRKFKDVQIKEDDLHKIIEAGMYAPTGMGLQTPFILALQKKEDVDLILDIQVEILNCNKSVRICLVNVDQL